MELYGFHSNIEVHDSFKDDERVDGPSLLSSRSHERVSRQRGNYLRVPAETTSRHERHESKSDFEGGQHILSVATYPSVPPGNYTMGQEIKDFLDCQITRDHR